MCVFMKCHLINNFLCNPKTTSPKKQKTFKGTPQRIGYMPIRDWRDAVEKWNLLRYAKYSDVHDDKIHPSNRLIRNENYDFLDRLMTYTDKKEFIRAFCEFTGFPNLTTISEKMNNAFKACIHDVTYYYGNSYKVIDAGYDPTCSLGQKKAFPGSDLDKGYVIIEGNDPYYSDERLVAEFKGKLWENLDSRLISQNHPDTAIDVFTKKQLHEKLDDISSTVTNIQIMPGAKTFWSCLFGPLGMAIGYHKEIIERTREFLDLKKSNIIDPYEAAKFNRILAKQLPREKREFFKNFAFFIEIVEANLRLNHYGKDDSIFNEILNSNFVRFSNVTQVNAWLNRIQSGYRKSKLRQREALQTDFAYMTTDTKFDLIKDVIRSSSNDQSSKFSQYFKNDDDIKDRYRPLLEALR